MLFNVCDTKVKTNTASATSIQILTVVLQIPIIKELLLFNLPVLFLLSRLETFFALSWNIRRHIRIRLPYRLSLFSFRRNTFPLNKNIKFTYFRGLSISLSEINSIAFQTRKQIILIQQQFSVEIVYIWNGVKEKLITSNAIFKDNITSTSRKCL